MKNAHVNFLKRNFTRPIDELFMLTLRQIKIRYSVGMLQYISRPPYPLTSVCIETNSECNRKCSWCPNSKNIRPKNMFLDEKIFYSIINQLAQMKFRGTIVFNLYNEPLLDKRLPEFFVYTRKKLEDSIISFNSNGDFLNLETWNILRKSGLDYANITSYDKEINDNIQEVVDCIPLDEKKHINVSLFDRRIISNRGGALYTNPKTPFKKFCSRPFRQLNISYRGKAILCCEDYFGKVEIGDLREKTIDELWDSNIFNIYRQELKKGNRSKLKLCNKCDHGFL